MVVSNITMDGVGAPIFMRLGNRARPFKEGSQQPGIGSMRNVTISNIEAADANPTGCAISGLPEAKIENVTLSNLRLSFAGGGTGQDAARAIPENPAAYPEYSMFGRLPAYGFYCRHVKGLKLHNVQLQTAAPELRHALVCDDVEDLVVDGLDAGFSPKAAATIRLIQTRRALICGCRPPVGTDTFLRLEGAATRRILLTGSDFRSAGKVVEPAADVPGDGFSVVGCLPRAH